MYMRKLKKCHRYVLVLSIVFLYFMCGSLGQSLCKGPQFQSKIKVNTTYIFNATADQPCDFVYSDLSILILSQILVRQCHLSSNSLSTLNFSSLLYPLDCTIVIIDKSR
jgi:hypothetical protein